MTNYKKMIIVFAMLPISPPIMALEASSPAAAFPPAKAGFQLRIDGVSGETKREGEPSREPGALVVKTARMSVSGDLSNTLSYFIRLDAAAPLYTTNYVGPDGSVAALERAYFTQKWRDWLVMRLGRIPTVAGSIELDYSSMDQYVNSFLLDQYVTHIFPTMTGLEFAATSGAHTLTLQLVDGIQEETGERRGTQTGDDMTMAVGYRAKLWDGHVKPILTWDHAGRVRAGDGASRDEKVFYTATGIGAQFSYAHADVDLEYDTLSRPAFISHKWDAAGAVTTIDNKAQRVATMVGQVAYTFDEERWRPFVKWSKDREKLDGSEHLIAVRRAAGIEYHPLAPLNLRYHAVIAKKEETMTRAAQRHSSWNSWQYIVGMAAKI